MDKAFTDAPIRNAAMARTFLRALHEAGLLYHPEDDAHDCLSHHKLPTETLDAIQARMDECHEHLDDPCEYALEVMDEG